VAVAIEQLGADLLAETEDLIGLVISLRPAGWESPTPAPGWSIRDQIGHLAYFDEQVSLAATDPHAFGAERLEALADVDQFVDRIIRATRRRPADGLVPWLQQARGAMIECTAALAPGVRIPWFGPDMSVASALTARIMETWAHGQDVADALGATRTPAARLRHVAFLGFQSFPNSYRSRGLEVPAAAVRVELEGAGGEPWLFGPEGAVDVVRGPAADFCLVVTQRRHLDDTDLVCVGPVASEWMGIAQAFAGPPGPGRRAGQVAH
jgi:uncharacterized protein (TIGR03084 family)